MSGAFQYRVNRLWQKTQANITAAVFFWELMKYVEAHTGLNFIAYGTGKVQTGVTPPSAWLNWNPLTQAVPWSNNSWFVFEATNADALLNGGGSNKWQCKAQVTLATGFDDCNVANVDYGQEATTYTCCLRCSAKGGWSAVTLDFPASADDNRSAYAGQDEYLYLDFVGDDDTILWRGSATINPTYRYAYARMSYIGMCQRRGTEITEPFFSMIGKIQNAGDGAGVNECMYRGTTGYWYSPFIYTNTIGWPSYSLWHDGTRIVGTDVHKLDPWSLTIMNLMRAYGPTGEDIYPAIMLAQWKSVLQYALIGELRFMYSCGSDKGTGQVVGSDPQWIQICPSSTSYGGILIRWPAGVSPIW